MQELVSLTGMVLKAAPVGEYDRRVVILTKERGKISAFARGARKPNSRLVAAVSPFCFGTFRMYEGRSSYNIAEAEIDNYFEGLREDFEGACYGMYFLEMMDACTRENNDEKELLLLLYQSLKALLVPDIPNRLIRYIVEIRTIVAEGEYPGIPGGGDWQESTLYALNHIANAPLTKLYTFTVTQPVLEEIGRAVDICKRGFWDRSFKSMRMIETLEAEQV